MRDDQSAFRLHSCMHLKNSKAFSYACTTISQIKGMCGVTVSLGAFSNLFAYKHILPIKHYKIHNMNFTKLFYHRLQSLNAALSNLQWQEFSLQRKSAQSWNWKKTFVWRVHLNNFLNAGRANRALYKTCSADIFCTQRKLHFKTIAKLSL